MLSLRISSTSIFTPLAIGNCAKKEDFTVMLCVVLNFDSCDRLSCSVLQRVSLKIFSTKSLVDCLLEHPGEGESSSKT